MVAIELESRRMATPIEPLRVCEAVQLDAKTLFDWKLHIIRHHEVTICIIPEKPVPYAWKPMLMKTNSVSLLGYRIFCSW